MHYREVNRSDCTVYDAVFELIMGVMDVCINTNIQVWQLETVYYLEEQHQKDNRDIHACRLGL